MAECKHYLEEAVCGFCREPIRKPAARVDLELIFDVVRDAEERQAIFAERIPGSGVWTESPYDKGGTSRSAQYRRDHMTEAQLARWGSDWTLEDTRQIFELKGVLTEDEIGELLGRTQEAIQLRRVAVRKELGLLAGSRSAA